MNATLAPIIIQNQQQPTTSLTQDQQQILSKLSPDQINTFLSIPASNRPLFFTGFDFLIGKNHNYTLTLENGTTALIKDLFVHGKLTIISLNPKDLKNLPTLIAYDVVVSGKLELKGVNLQRNKFYQI